MNTTQLNNADRIPNGEKSTLMVGWIGAGKMGAPMIRNLLRKGTKVAVTDPIASALSSLTAFGATEAPNLSDHVNCQIVFSTLPNDQILLDVVCGKNGSEGIAGYLRKGAIFVEMSTVSPVCSKRVASTLEAAGVRYLRAPLSGSTALAEKAALTILASGDKTAWEEVQPLLDLLCSKRFYLGEADEARYMKLVLNTIVGATSAVLAEALSIGASGGLTRANMMEVISDSVVASPLLAYKSEAVGSGTYPPAFTISQMIKDFTLISETARAHEIPLLTTGLILELYRSAANSGLAEEDFFALVKWHAAMTPDAGR